MKAHLLALLLPAAAWADPLPAPLDPADFDSAPAAELRLGQLLFYDPILSGNRTVSCATCHHPKLATGDGVALGIGDGGTGLGPERRIDPENPPEQRIPRNAPPLFNLGHRDIHTLFADGRIEADPDRPSGLRTPLEDDMVAGFDGILSAQTMFPVLSPDEMAGHYAENDIAQAVRQGFLTGEDGAWSLISQRVAGIPAYARMFAEVYPEIAAGRPVAFTDISNAIAAFVAVEWRADDSAFDRHLRGEAELTGAAAEGMALFYGTARCSSCHSGPLLSDQGFHAMGTPQLGPGKAARFETHQRDTGRMRVTGRPEDAYAFRTPMLRNVTETGPWGHAGAHDDLRAFLRFHADPVAGLAAFDTRVPLPAPGAFAGDWTILETAAERAAIAEAVRTAPVTLDEDQIDALMAFLHALRDETALAGRLGVPEAVPSGLPVD
ncbi:cytochrome-c peroxidase [Pseudoponticoccus marisrubri]|uniref:Cytochrome-c peroxidase n=1 Tax=Pseudoponticoccus marisrubri TaxID=1685382 RepID=A0A0W7WNG7_9RHOB|nr:cytochrome c peroxidase [Pseudoponticoccus marisrubri]KUF12128.1 cytochrome-c peroxidase [Pseudoponticoccus marisrubri]